MYQQLLFPKLLLKIHFFRNSSCSNVFFIFCILNNNSDKLDKTPFVSVKREGDYFVRLTLKVMLMIENFRGGGGKPECPGKTTDLR